MTQKLTPAELEPIAAMIQRGNAEIEAGGGLDVEEALRKLADKHGLTIQR